VQGFTYAGSHVTMATKLFMVTPRICGSSVCQLSGAYDFEFSNTFLENVCTPDVGDTQIRTENNNSSQKNI
jgi:hypothetical protein